jgi:NADP-dependent 3-hydroxy acid dehydrogenase YdfG
MKSLRGKTVLITGASAGIGRSTALAFAALGCKLILCARRLDSLTEFTPQLFEAGAADVLNIKLDVQDRKAVETELGSDLDPDWQDIEVLVNNAGLSRGLIKMQDDDIENWEEMIDTNVKGLLYVTRTVVPGMIARNAGHIINLGSTAGHQTYGNGVVYCATKAAERVISEGLNIDVLNTPLRVTSIDPGMVETEFSTVRFRGDSDKAANVYKGFTPLTPEDIADAIVWAATRPAHVNVQSVLITSVDQANSNLTNRK